MVAGVLFNLAENAIFFLKILMDASDDELRNGSVSLFCAEIRSTAGVPVINAAFVQLFVLHIAP
jgi:hypothetical protein